MYLFNQLSSFMNYFNNSNKIIVSNKYNPNPDSINVLRELYNKSRQDQELHKFINYLIKEGPKDNGLRMTAHILE